VTLETFGQFLFVTNETLIDICLCWTLLPTKSTTRLSQLPGLLSESVKVQYTSRTCAVPDLHDAWAGRHGQRMLSTLLLVFLIQSAVDMSDKIYCLGEARFNLSGDVNRIA